MKVSSIVAMGKNRVIGLDNQMMWHIPSEFRHYRDLLGDHFFAIGRKNYEGSHKKLNSKRAILLTKNRDYTSDALVCHSPEEAIDLALQKDEKELFVLGGEEIYRAFMPFIDTLYLSIVDFEKEGEAYFPEHEHLEWELKNHFKKGVDQETTLSWEFFELRRVR